MVPETTTHRSSKAQGIKIAAVNPAEQEKKFREAVARRAYQLFESHGCSPGHAAEDWRRAELDLLRPLACGVLAGDDKVSVTTDISAFNHGSVDVCVEPRRLTLCGTPRTQNASGESPFRDPVYRVLTLPVEVDPAQVRARFNGRILQIDLFRTPLLTRAA